MTNKNTEANSAAKTGFADCEQCGHEMAADAGQCAFCGAPSLRKPLLAWPPVEPAKWAMLGLLVYGLFHLSFYL